MKKMKYIAFFLGALIVLACDKEETRVTFLKSTPPVLVASSTADLVLNKAQENFSSLQFQWTNPTFEFSNGVNTQSVSYVLQIDEGGKNFGSAKQVNLGFTNSVSKSFTVKELNTTLSGLELADFVAQNFEFRIKATLANNSVPVYSNVVAIKITTYLDVVYPVPANLFIIGDATPGGWNNTVSNLDPSQRFTKINTFTYQINSIALTGGKYYLLLPVAGSWNNKYAFRGAKNQNNPLGDVFIPDSGEDFLAPSTSGNYKVTVNFKTAKVSLEKL
jgi:hypothetical protein